MGKTAQRVALDIKEASARRARQTLAIGVAEYDFIEQHQERDSQDVDILTSRSILPPFTPPERRVPKRSGQSLFSANP